MKKLIIVILILMLSVGSAAAFTFTLNFPNELVDFLMYLDMILPQHEWNMGGLTVDGDLKVNTSNLFVDSSTGNISIGTLAGGDGSSYVCVDEYGVIFSQEGGC